jgi:hypothetical protein
MNDSGAARLATSLRRRIARRLQIARWGKILLVPTIGAIVLFGNHSSWIAGGAIILFLLEVVAINLGEGQRCPLCDTSLVVRRERREEFATACPECGYVID